MIQHHDKTRLVRFTQLGCLAGLVAGCLLGCNGKPIKSKERPTTQPAQAAATSPSNPTILHPAPAPTAPSTPEPTPPAATQPVSTYDSSPPYTVRLYVRKPQDEQPGWLKIVELSNDQALATCTGEFPEHNRIVIDTDNVRKLRLHIGHLPLAAGKRTILRIDKQGMELITKNRRYIDFERRDTGEWSVTGSE